MKYEIGDIVFVSKYKYEDGDNGQNHLFVIIDEEDNLVPAEYFGFIVSSRIEKSKENSKFKYNEALRKDKNNKLNTDSIVKCDQIYKIPAKNIQFKIGQVDIDDFNRFMEAYNSYLQQVEKELQDT